jgi:hypothetical protein
MSMKSKRNGTSTTPAEQPPVGAALEITDRQLTVTLRDGRVISTPLEWYPSLVRATPKQRANWRWWGDGSAGTGLLYAFISRRL